MRLNDTACANCPGLFMLEGEVSVTRNSKRTLTHTAQGVGRECVERSLREDGKTRILCKCAFRWGMAWEGMLKDIRFSAPQ